MEEQAIWRGITKDKYEAMERGWRTKDVNMPYGCGLGSNTVEGWVQFSGKCIILGYEMKS